MQKPALWQQASWKQTQPVLGSTQPLIDAAWPQSRGRCGVSDFVLHAFSLRKKQSPLLGGLSNPSQMTAISSCRRPPCGLYLAENGKAATDLSRPSGSS